MKKNINIISSVVTFLIILLLGIYLFNYIKLQSVLNEVIEQDPLNHGIDASVNYENYIDTSTVVFKLQPLPKGKNLGDAYRVILQFIDRIDPKNLEQMDLIFNNQKNENILLAQYELQNLMEKVLANDPRNTDIQVLVYYSGLTNPKELVYDLRDISGEKSQLDVFRVFLQYASLAKDLHFDTVHLYFKGDPRFKIHGDYFEKIGKEFDFQNPAYTIRTFPENVMNPDGTNAFPEWTGGMLGVFKEQMEDFNDFNKKWYLESWIKSQNSPASNN
jgi:hypothetical protein